MRASLLLILTVVIVLTASMTTYAQSDWWEDGCDERVIDEIAETTDMIDYRSACEQYRQCDNQGEGNFVCQFIAFEMMIDDCVPQDVDLCYDGAILMASAILVYDYPIGESIDWQPPQTVINNLPIALEAYWNGDEETTLELLELPTADDDYVFNDFDTNYTLSRAVLYQRASRYDEAFAEYDRIFNIEFVHPLASYARSQLYGELGRDDEASFEVTSLVYQVGNIPHVSRFVNELYRDYPLEAGVVRSWALYPITFEGFGSGGTSARDSSLIPPRRVQIGIYEELDIILVIGVMNWSPDPLSSRDDTVLILRDEDGDGDFSIGYPSYYDNYGGMHLTLEDGVITGNEFIAFFEGSANWDFMIAPLEAPDPRSILEDQRICESSVLTRLEIGATFTGSQWYEPNFTMIYNEPDGNIIGEITDFYEIFTVLEYPICSNGVTWWRGYSTQGRLGWIPENDGNNYLTEAGWQNPEQMQCDGQDQFIITQLNVGMSAIVVGNDVTLYDDPLTDDIWADIPFDTQVEIVGGPICYEFDTWWYVDVDGALGWMIEWDDPEFLLEPVE